MVKTYKELNTAERLETFVKHQEICKKDDCVLPYKDFAEYDHEQEILNMDFDEQTLECLG